MPESRIILAGPCFAGPQYYGQLNWSETDVYLRHPLGGKDSRHSDGGTFLTGPGPTRDYEHRVPMSAVRREHLNFVALPVGAPKPLQGIVRPTDIVLEVDSATSRPKLAVEIVRSGDLEDAIAEWQQASGVSSIVTVLPKGLGQALLVAVAKS